MKAKAVNKWLKFCFSACVHDVLELFQTASKQLPRNIVNGVPLSCNAISPNFLSPLNVDTRVTALQLVHGQVIKGTKAELTAVCLVYLSKTRVAMDPQHGFQRYTMVPFDLEDEQLVTEIRGKKETCSISEEEGR